MSVDVIGTQVNYKTMAAYDRFPGNKAGSILGTLDSTWATTALELALYVSLLILQQ